MSSSTYYRGNKLVAGSTQSGKSYAEIHDVLAAAETPSVAIVLLDPHRKSLAWKSFEQLVARGMAPRILFDQLVHLDRTLGYRFIRPARSRNPKIRAAANEQAARQFTDLLTRRRESASLATAPLTEQYTMHAVMLLIHQRQERPASDLRYAFQPHHPTFRSMLHACTDADTKHVIAEIADGTIRRGQYAAADRLIQGVCGSPAFVQRCGTMFDLHRFLDRRGILLVEGGGYGVSEDAQRTIFGSIVMDTINYVRTRRRPFPRVLLVLDEAVNAGLIGASGFETRALAECSKMGLDIHVMVQNPTSFPSRAITDDVFTNCTSHHWFYQANDAAARMAAADLGDPDYREAVKTLRVGERFVKVRTSSRTFVYREQVPALPDPWAFPGLTEKKAWRALTKIRNRPEYQSDPWQSIHSETGENEKNISSVSLTSTPSPDDTCEHSSPAIRLRTRKSRSSSSNENSAESEP